MAGGTCPPAEKTIALASPATISDRIRFSHNGRYLALVFLNGEFAVRDLQTGAVHAVPTNVANPGRFMSVAFSPDDRLLASNVSSIPGGPQPTVIWQLDPWHSIATYPGMVGATMAPQFTTDGTSAILAVEHTAIRWNYSRPAFQQPSGHADKGLVAVVLAGRLDLRLGERRYR